MSLRKKKYYKIVAVVLALFVTGLGCTTALAECEGVKNCAKTSNTVPNHHGFMAIDLSLGPFMKMEIMEQKKCCCEAELPCHEFTAGVKTSFHDQVILNNGRPFTPSKSILTVFQSIPHFSINVNGDNPETPLITAQARTGPLYLQTQNLRF